MLEKLKNLICQYVEADPEKITEDSRFVEDLGFNSLRITASANNLFCLTKYTGVDPEVTYGAWGVCYDNSKTPRAKSFTLSINLGF